jgi:phage gpG-like protein
MGRIDKVKRFSALLPRELTIIVREVKSQGLRFFKSSFRKQGFTDKVFIPWRRRKNDPNSHSAKFGRKRIKGRAILVQSGDLRRSIKGVARPNEVVFSSDLPYARIHNDGGTISHPGGTGFIPKKGGAVFISNSKRKELEAEGKKVLVTKPHKIKMPRRRFMGPSAFLMEELSAMAEKRLKKLWKDA